MRLRPLTEAECYARCYGGTRTDQVSVLRPGAAPAEREQSASERDVRGDERQERAA